jgi:hypothetical protein
VQVLDQLRRPVHLDVRAESEDLLGDGVERVGADCSRQRYASIRSTRPGSNNGRRAVTTSAGACTVTEAE